MKKYTSQATKYFAIAALICGVVFFIGVVAALLDVENIGVPIGLITLGGLCGILFLSCFLLKTVGH